MIVDNALKIKSKIIFNIIIKIVKQSKSKKSISNGINSQTTEKKRVVFGSRVCLWSFVNFTQ